MQGRPVIYIPAKNHSANDREIEELTKFIAYCLVSSDNIRNTYIVTISIHGILRKRLQRNPLKMLLITSALCLI